MRRKSPRWRGLLQPGDREVDRATRRGFRARRPRSGRVDTPSPGTTPPIPGPTPAVSEPPRAPHRPQLRVQGTCTAGPRGHALATYTLCSAPPHWRSTSRTSPCTPGFARTANCTSWVEHARSGRSPRVAARPRCLNYLQEHRCSTSKQSPSATPKGHSSATRLGIGAIWRRSGLWSALESECEFNEYCPDCRILPAIARFLVSKMGGSDVDFRRSG